MFRLQDQVVIMDKYQNTQAGFLELCQKLGGRFNGDSVASLFPAPAKIRIYIIK